MTDEQALKVVVGYGKHATQDEQADAWQHLVDNGVVWELAHFVQEVAKKFVAVGLCHR